VKPNYRIVLTEEAFAACIDLKTANCKRGIKYVILATAAKVSLMVKYVYLLFLLFLYIII
jgi:uncharacterized membrane protein